MDQSVLYRLVLAKLFLETAERNLTRGDVHSLAVAVVNAHDAVDSLLGAIATARGLQLAGDVTLLSTFGKIGSSGLSLGGGAKLAQLNALRNDVKHQGLHPNPNTVQALLPEISSFCDGACAQIFSKPLREIHVTDAIATSNVRESMALILKAIEDGDYRNALEQMAFVVFDVHEQQTFTLSRWIRRFIARQQGQVAEEPEYDFPALDPLEKRLELMELGLLAEEYDRFHLLVPQVGTRRDSATAYVLRKSQYLWHEKNWTRENALNAFDFLMRLILAKQERQRPDSLIRINTIAELRFIRDSHIADIADKSKTIATKKEGEVIFGSGLPWVEGSWQNFGEELVCDRFYYGSERVLGCIKKADVEVKLLPPEDEEA